MVAAVLFSATSCLNGENDKVDPDSGQVKLYAGIRRSEGATYRSVPTRGSESSTSGVIDPAWNGELNIGLARVSFAEDRDVYPDFCSLGDPMTAVLGLPDESNSYYRPIEFLHQAQFFPDMTNELRYAGWYPWKEGSSPTVDAYGSTYVSDALKTEVTMQVTGDKDVMYGNMIAGTHSKGFSAMEFDHALCLFRIHAYAMVGGVDVEGEGTITSDEWGSIEHLVIKNVPQTVTLTLPHNCRENGSNHNSDPNVFTVSYAGKQNISLDDEDNDIYFNSPEHLPIGISNAVLVSKCIVAPPSNGILNIGVKASAHENEHEVLIARNFKPGHAYDIILRFSAHGLINADVEVAEWTIFERGITQTIGQQLYYNLSAYETANCYIVPSANYSYSFDATVRGNGEGEMLGLTPELMAIEPGYMKVLWDDIPAFDHDKDPSTSDIETFELESNSVVDGNVLFHVRGYSNEENKALPVEGNVLLGAFDKDPDKGGKLIWTWHLWITDKPQGVGCGSGYVIMDRNLGAIASVPTGESNHPARGLYYQWGRPVPLKVEGLQTSPDLLTFRDFFHTNDPNTLYGSGVESADDDHAHGWLSKNSKMWEHHDHMWGDTSVAFETPHKTILDPCPPGYFVTPHSFWEGIEQYEVQYKSGFGVELNMESESFWLPCQSIINDEGVLNEAFKGVALRTSTINYQDTNSHHTPYYLAYTASKTAKVSSENSYGNYAIPVRCISEATDPVVVDLSASQTANCYMVNGPGYYKFKANVRGNGVSMLKPFVGPESGIVVELLDLSDGMDVNIKPAKVDLYWWQGDFTEMATINEDEMIEKLMCVNIMYDGKLNDEGYIMFRIDNFHPGNAILAAYSTSGEILWTWHLWLTKERPKDLLSGRRSVQDRFLGATQAPVISSTGTSLSLVDYHGNTSTDNNAVWATYGFYYQWGRKDPIMGVPVGTTGDGGVSGNNLTCSPYWVKDWATGNWEKQTTIPCASQTGIKESVQAPLVFHKSSNGAGDANSQWFSADFANGKKNVALWGYAVNDYAAGKDFSKTMYDPCPPGYQTAFHDVWRIVINGTNYAYGGDDDGNQVYEHTNNETSFSSYGFVTTKNYFDRNWYPYSGLRLATTGGYSQVGTYGFVGTGLPMGGYNTRSFRYWKQHRSGNTNKTAGSEQIHGSSTDSSASVTSGNHSSAYAKPIRCMKQ